MLSVASRALTAGLVVALALTISQPAALAAVTVNVNGQPLNLSPGPIERAGRVFVPLRGIFERLGAAVVYSSGTINATKGSTTVSLHIGSTQATVNGQAQTLDVAPFIVGATTYMPLRFVAQSLGARVNYDDGTQLVSIDLAGGVAIAPPRPVPPPYPPPSSAVRLRAQSPGEGAAIRDRFAVVAARFTYNVNPASVRVWLDGNNITSRSGVSSTGFSYKPPAPLDWGAHTVRVAGRAAGGAQFDRSWSFSVLRSAAPVMHLTILQPGSNQAVGRTFTVAGTTVPNGRIRVTAGATPSFTGQFSGNTNAGGGGNFKLVVTLTTLIGQQAVSVRVTATDPATSASTESTLQLRLRI